MTTDEGTEILIHVGIDTVKIEGKGSTHSVKAGERVKAGQPLVVFGDDKILDVDYKDTILVVVTNWSEVEVIENVVDFEILDEEHSVVKAGEPLMRVTMKQEETL